MSEIINRVKNSSLVTIDINEFYIFGDREVLDISIFLDSGILREKKFRELISKYQWSNYKNKFEKIGITNSYELSSILLNKIGIISVPGECFNTSGLNLRFSLIDIDIDNIFLINEIINTTYYPKMIEGFTKLINFLNNL